MSEEGEEPEGPDEDGIEWVADDEDNGVLLSEGTVYIVDVKEFAEKHNADVIFCSQGPQLFVLDKDTRQMRTIESKAKGGTVKAFKP